MMKKFLVLGLLPLLVACQTTSRLEDDTHVKFAKVVDVHTFTVDERKEAAKTTPRPSNTGVGMGIGLGVGTGGFSGGFGGVMIGAPVGRSRAVAPQIADGANRFTVQPIGTTDRIEVLSYGKYQVGDCVKVLSGHPTEYARLFELREGEHCEQQAPAPVAPN